MKKNIIIMTITALALLNLQAPAQSSGAKIFWKLSFEDPSSLSNGGLQLFPENDGSGEFKATARTDGGEAYRMDDVGIDSGHTMLRMDGSRRSGLVVQCPEDTGIERDDFSIAFWIKPEENGSGYLATNGTTAPMWLVSLDPDLRLVVNFNGYPLEEAAGKTQAVSSASPLEPGVWHHVAVVFDRAESILIYIDGLLDTTGRDNIASHTGTMRPNVILAGGYDPYPTGMLGEVSFYRGKLADEEIATLAKPKTP